MTKHLIAALRFAFLSLLASMMLVPAHAQEAADKTAPEKRADPRDNLENVLYLDLSTGGLVEILLYPQIAPGHVERIKTLARQGFYNNIVFHRVIEGFMAQTGDPLGTGEGGSNLPNLKAEFSRQPHLRGIVSAARTGNDENSANSQFFITFMPRFELDNNYTVFGRVFKGMQFVDTIKRGEPPRSPDRIIQASIAADGKPLPNFAPVATPALTEAAISVK